MVGSLRFVGGRILGPSRFEVGDLVLRAGRFSTQTDPRDRVLPVEGLWLLPGIVDLHGDGFERQLAPRRGMMTDLGRGLRMVEAELAQCGVTTAWLAQFWSWEGGMRGPEFAKRFAEALRTARLAGVFRLDLRMQLRLEMHLVADREAILELVRAQDIDYLVFNDHLPHAHLSTGRSPPRLVGAALKAGRSPEAHLELMTRCAARSAEVPAFIRALVRDLPAGMRFGSHDDPDPETRARARENGLTICEFPTTEAAARAAQDQGAPVVMGAPNVVRGGSHDKRVSAGALVAAGLVDALASDYHYPSLADAAFALSDRGICSFDAAWRLISARPADVMGLSDRGEIAEGKRADLVVIDPQAREILGTFAAGAPAYLSGRLADLALAA